MPAFRPERGRRDRRLRAGALRWLAVTALCLGAGAAKAEIFMRLDGVEGGSTDPDHKGWIDVDHVQQTHVATGIIESPVSAIAAVRKQVDASSPKLAGAATLGQIYPEVEFEFGTTDDGFQRLFRLELRDVSVLSHRLQVESNGESFEYVVLLFERVDWTYVEYDTAGRILANHKAYWDLARNVGDAETERIAFVVQASRVPGAGLKLEWMAEEGRSYQLRATSDLGESFEPIQEILPGEAGKRTLDLPATKPFAFYYLTERPE